MGLLDAIPGVRDVKAGVEEVSNLFGGNKSKSKNESMNITVESGGTLNLNTNGQVGNSSSRNLGENRGDTASFGDNGSQSPITVSFSQPNSQKTTTT